MSVKNHKYYLKCFSLDKKYYESGRICSSEAQRRTPLGIPPVQILALQANDVRLFQ